MTILKVRHTGIGKHLAFYSGTSKKPIFHSASMQGENEPKKSLEENTILASKFLEKEYGQEWFRKVTLIDWEPSCNERV